MSDSLLNELRAKVNQIHQAVVPGLRELLDSHDFPFATQNGVIRYGQDLLKVVLEAKGLVAKLDASRY